LQQTMYETLHRQSLDRPGCSLARPSSRPRYPRGALETLASRAGYLVSPPPIAEAIGGLQPTSCMDRPGEPAESSHRVFGAPQETASWVVLLCFQSSSQ